MFNETSYVSGVPIDPITGMSTQGIQMPTCAPGEIATDVGGDAPICLNAAQRAAYGQSVNQVLGGGSSLPTWVMPVALGLIVLMVVGKIGGRR